MKYIGPFCPTNLDTQMCADIISRLADMIVVFVSDDHRHAHLGRVLLVDEMSDRPCRMKYTSVSLSNGRFQMSKRFGEE